MILEFDYLKKFKCTSIDCINTCCSGWDIHVDAKTLSKIKNSNDPKIEDFFFNKLKKFPLREPRDLPDFSRQQKFM